MKIILVVRKHFRGVLKRPPPRGWREGVIGLFLGREGVIAKKNGREGVIEKTKA